MSERRPGQSLSEHIARLDAERENWVRGEHGEQLVATELDRLTPGEWWVFHSIPRGSAGTDLDHLVIGVGGIFTVNTKNVSADVWVVSRVLMVGGTRTNYLPAAASEARDVARRLQGSADRPVEVKPLLVFTRSITIKEKPVDVVVLEADALRRWLERQPRALTPTRAQELALVADRPETWT